MEGKHIAIMFAGGFLAMIVGFLALWQLLTPRDVPKAEVSWDTLQADVASGKVREVGIVGSSYDYYLREAKPPRRHTTGPKPTLAIVTSFDPTRVYINDRVDHGRLPEQPPTIVAFSDFVHEARSGRVKSANIHGQFISFDDGTKPRVTTGPEATRAEWQAFLTQADGGAPILLTFD